MKRSVAIFSSIVLFVCAFAPPVLAADDEAQIKKLEDRYVKAAEAHDIDGVMACYMPGADLVLFDVIPPRQYQGAEAVRKDWEGFLGTVKGPVALEMSNLKIVTDGKLGFARNIQHWTYADKSGKKVDFTIRVTDDLRKVNGKWVIAQQHASVPVDLATGKADLSSAP